MVEGVSEGGGVGEHNGVVALLPKGIMVGPGYAGDKGRDGAALRGELAI